MGDFYTNPVHHPEDTGIGHIRRTVNLAQFGNATNGRVPIGALEAGAVPMHCHVYIETAFNAATTNVLEIGTIDDDDGFCTSANAAAGSTGWKDNQKGALSGIPLAADKIVYARFQQSGTAATTGKAVVTLYFVNKRDAEGIPFPNN